MPSHPKHVIALSGGKDSTAMALRLHALNPETDYEIVCTPTGDELPPMLAHFDKLESIFGKPLKRLPNITLEECIEREQMIPNFRARFCTRIIKIEPFIDYMESLPAGSVMYVGLRADEEERLGLQPPNAQFDVVCPMQDWGWTLGDVYGYLDTRGIEVPKRTDCGACFYQQIGEWFELWRDYPERWEKYCQIEERMGHTFRSPSRDTWPASLREMGKEFASGRRPRNSKPRQGAGAKCRFCTM